jgi:acetate kinase
MATRPGALDPGLLTYLISHQRLNASELDSALNEGSGLLGVSGVSADLRKVLAAKKDGSSRATLAYGIFIHSLIRMVGAMIAVLGGLDNLVFTGGIGEHNSLVRSDVAAALTYTGLNLSLDKNEGPAADLDIAATGSGARVLVITAREDLTVLSEVRRLLWRDGSGPDQ